MNSDLPEELILEILKYVDNVYSIINYLTTSKQINTKYGKMFWINLFKVYFPDAIEYCNTHIKGLYDLYYDETAYKHKMRFIHCISYLNKSNLKSDILTTIILIQPGLILLSFGENGRHGASDPSIEPYWGRCLDLKIGRS